LPVEQEPSEVLLRLPSIAARQRLWPEVLAIRASRPALAAALFGPAGNE